jgi:hypothetical protein
MSGVISGLLPSDGLGVVDAEACFDCRANVYTGRCLATDVFLGSAIPAFSRHVTIFFLQNMK